MVIGPFINAGAVLLGGVLGAVLSQRLPERIRTSMPSIFGLASLGIGILLVIKCANLPVMVLAVLITVAIMLVAADPLANFINNNPTVVMLALGFLIMIGMTLIAEGFGAHVPKGYVYAAMAFSTAIEILNILARRARLKREAAEG